MAITAARRKVTKGENPCRIMEEEGVHQVGATLLDRRAAACKQSGSPGPLLLGWMIDLSIAVREPHHDIRLNVSFRSDLEWWATFLPLWNRMGMYRIRAIHIPGRENGAADALSCNCLAQFRSQVQQAEAQPSPLPKELLDMLVHRCPDWTSPP